MSYPAYPVHPVNFIKLLETTGSETNGLPEHLSKQWPERFASIPMSSGARCLNLATSIGIVIYEALRQQNFAI